MAVQFIQIDSEAAEELFESRSTSPESIYNKLLFENVVSALRVDAVAAARVSAATLRGNVLRGNSQRDELFYWNGEEGCVARNRKTARAAVGGLGRAGSAD